MPLADAFNHKASVVALGKGYVVGEVADRGGGGPDGSSDTEGSDDGGSSSGEEDGSGDGSAGPGSGDGGGGGGRDDGRGGSDAATSSDSSGMAEGPGGGFAAVGGGRPVILSSAGGVCTWEFVLEGCVCVGAVLTQCSFLLNMILDVAKVPNPTNN